MKIFLPVFLALCLGILPVFSQDVQASAATAVMETESAEAGSLEIDALSSVGSTEAMVDQAAVFGGDVPQLSMLHAFGGMGLVLCLLVGAYFCIRKFAPGYFPKMSSEGKNLKVIENLGMGDRRSIALVEVGGKRFLVGSTPQQINLLTTLPDHFSLVGEEDDLNISKDVKVEIGEEKQIFRNMFERGRPRSARYTGHVLPDEVRQKMRRLREALENR